MKNIIKRLMSIVLTLTLIASFGNFSNAINLDGDKVQNQIDLLLESNNPEDHIEAIKLMELKGQKIMRYKITVDDLLNNMSNFERDKYEKEIISEIESLRTMDEDELVARNFTKDQIRTIKNFDGTTEMALAAAPTITVYGGFNNYNRQSSSTTTQMVSAFTWNNGYSGFGAPWQDIFACVWSEPFNPTSETGHLSYYRAENYSTVNTNATVIPDSLRGSHIKVPQSLSNSNGTHWIKAGSIISNLRSNASVADVVGFASYGKNTVSLTPGVTFNSSGTTLGITFSLFVTRVGQARYSN